MDLFHLLKILFLESINFILVVYAYQKCQFIHTFLGFSSGIALEIGRLEIGELLRMFVNKVSTIGVSSPFRDGTGRLLLPEPLPGHLVNEVVAADPGPGPIQAGAPV